MFCWHSWWVAETVKVIGAGETRRDRTGKVRIAGEHDWTIPIYTASIHLQNQGFGVFPCHHREGSKIAKPSRKCLFMNVKIMNKTHPAQETNEARLTGISQSTMKMELKLSIYPFYGST